jgi:hypothetical protein
MILGMITLVGVLLGLRFRPLSLVPAVLFGGILVAGDGLARGEPTQTIVLTVILSIVGVQFGYFGGAVTRALIAHSLAEEQTNIPSPVR